MLYTLLSGQAYLQSLIGYYNFELFSNIQEIGNEIDFTRLSSASPELLIKNISIAGNKN